MIRSAKFGHGVEFTSSALTDFRLSEHAEKLTKLLKNLSFSLTGPGQNGAGVIIEKEKEEDMKELFKINQFNLMASDRISVNRTLPDYRSAK